MADYLLLYSGGSMPEGEAAQKAVMDAWESWFGTLGNSMKDAGNPFTPAAMNIAADGSVSDGPAGSMASGYSVITADSLDDAVAKAKGCPVLQGGASISVFETFNVM